MSARQLPLRPDIQQLKHQAKDFLRAARAGEPSAVADFREHHPQQIDPVDAKLADAQHALAHSYHASSWPRLVTICTLINRIYDDDVAAIRELLLANHQLLEEYATAPDSGWHTAMTEAANHGLRRIVGTFLDSGARGVEAAMARPELRPMLDTLLLLGRLGARPPRDAFGGAVELLQGVDFALMTEVGAEVRNSQGEWRSLVALALETYTRNPAGKHQILEIMAAQDIPLPDTPPMAVHRGRLDLLEQHLRRDPALFQRTFSHRDIWPPELGCHADEALALHGAPLAGATMLHMAADYEELEVIRWLLDCGMDPNVRADVDADGFGGHTALFNCVVGYNAGRRDDPVARLLLARGADPNIRASIRKGLAFSRDSSIHDYRDVTPLGWGRRFHDQTYVSQAAMRIIAEHGGHE